MKFGAGYHGNKANLKVVRNRHEFDKATTLESCLCPNQIFLDPNM